MKKTVKKPLLSISFLTYGRDKTVKKCLDSLIPIMEALPCELIIVDTGCSEEMVTLLKEYTDKIIPFTWCNDFSKARNVGLHKATGKWFMYIDDDEWFADSSEIISFFKTGEYKKYAVACYIARNYLDYDEKNWEDAYVSRLIRLDKDTHFKSSIHEYLYPIKGEFKLLSSYVKHFGYVYDSEEERKMHSNRNVNLLLEVIKKEPNDIRWWGHLAQEYVVIRDMEKLERLCEDGLRHFKNKYSPSIIKYVGSFYTGLLTKYFLNNDYKNAEDVFKEALEDPRTTNICKARINARIAEIYYVTERFEECAQCCEEYIRLYEMLHDKEVECFMQSGPFTYDAFNKNVRDSVYEFYIKCCTLKGDSEGFIQYFNKMSWEENHMNLHITFVNDVLEGMAILPYTDEFISMAQKIMERQGCNTLAFAKLKELEENAPQKFEALYNIFSKTNPPALYREPKQKEFSVESSMNQEAAIEMKKLANQIKEKIQVLIKQGLYTEANEILKQLKTFVPVNDEIIRLEEKIKSMSNK